MNLSLYNKKHKEDQAPSLLLPDDPHNSFSIPSFYSIQPKIAEIQEEEEKVRSRDVTAISMSQKKCTK